MLRCIGSPRLRLIVRLFLWMVVSVGFAMPPIDALSFSSRYLTRSSPFSPTSHEECEALNQEFAQDVRMLTEQHAQCLSDAPHEQTSEGGTCSKLSCQPLHTAMNSARARQGDEVKKCSTRVNEYLEEKRRKDEAARREASEAERVEHDRSRAKDREVQEETERNTRAQKAEEKRQQRELVERERLKAEERERQAAEFKRQAYIAGVLQIAQQVKQEWHDRLRTGVPDVVADISRFVEASRSMLAPKGSLSMPEFVGAADKLVERAENVRAWITSPLHTVTDQIRSDAIRMVLAEPEQKQTDERLSAMFHSVKKMKEIAHEQNPFAKTISAQALTLIERQFNSALGELNRLEAQLGTFQKDQLTTNHGPLVNPFKLKSPQSHVTTMAPFTNPFAAGPDTVAQDTLIAVEKQDPSANPFRSRQAAITRDSPSTSESTSTSRLRNESPSTASPLSASPDKNAIVRYRDPATKQVSTKRLIDLTPSAKGDSPTSSYCSPDGIGIITEKCETLRREHAKKQAN